jgi:hypothetical protein
MTDLDLAAVRTFLAWEKPESDHAMKALHHLIALVASIERLMMVQQQVQQLPAHWRVCAIHAETDAEKETWQLCADQLQDVLQAKP